ncbi:MAG TPA: hypothetical protein ENN17_00140 [bacterium]|nr:hypothetical protein [bacterium]
MARLIFIGILSVILVAAPAARAQDYDMKKLDFEATANRPLEVYLNVDAGEIYIEKGKETLKGGVDVEFETERVRTRIDFDEKRNRLRVAVDGRKWYKTRDGMRGPIVRVVLPDSVHIRLKTRLKAGECHLELGGLRIEELDVTSWAGELTVRFDEPNPIVMTYMDIHLHVGEANLVRLGNARFDKAELKHGIGSLSVDFSGTLVHRSMARVGLNIGEAHVLLPDDAGIRMQIGGAFSFLSAKDIDSDFYKRGRYFYTDGFDEAGTQMSLRMTPGLGELRVERR